jgi:hypothetical protein
MAEPGLASRHPRVEAGTFQTRTLPTFFRYGNDDDLVMQLKHELESLDSLEARKAKNIAMKSRGRSRHDEYESSMPLR